MWRHKDLKRPCKLVLSKGFFFNLEYGFVDETKLLTEFIYFIMARDSECDASRHWFCRLRWVWWRVSSNTLYLSNSLPWFCLGRLNQQQRKLLWLGWKCENGRKKFIEVATNYCACWKLSTRFVLMNPAYFLSKGLRKMVQRRLSKKVFTCFGKNFHRSEFKCCFVQKEVKLTIARYKQCSHKSF